MRKASALLVVVLLLLTVPTASVHAKDDGIFNRSNGCTCHSSSGSLTPSLTGLPSAYTAGTTYGLTVAMSGSPATGGFNLEINKGALSNPGQHARLSGNALQATHDFSPGTVSWTMDWTAPSSGSGSVLFALAVLSGNNNGGSSGDGYATMSTSVSEAVASNDPPSISDVTLSPSSPTTLDDLTATYVFTDNDGDGESGTAYAWHRNGVLDAGQTSATLPAASTAKGETWHVVITPSDGTDAGTPVTSPSVDILNSAPSVTGFTLSSQAPDTSEDVSVSFTGDDADGDAVTQSHLRWRLDGVVVEGLENATLLPALATRAGDVWDVQVRLSDSETLSPWFTSPSVVVSSSNTAPVVSDVVVVSNITSTDDLLIEWTATDDDGDEVVDEAIVWLKHGVEVEAAKDLNPLPASFTAKGDVWTALVSVWDGEAWSLQTSGPQITVENTPPRVDSVRLESPSFSALHDLTVNVTTADSDGDAVTVTDVRWYVNGAEESATQGETTLPSTLLHRGEAWHVLVTVSDGEGTSQSISDSVTVVNAAPQVTVVWPSASYALSALSPTITVEDADGDATTLAISWFKNGFRDASLENRTSVPAAKLAPGQIWTLVAQASDSTEAGLLLQSDHVVGNMPPMAAIEQISAQVWFNERVVFSAANSSDEDGTIVEYQWTWNGQSARGQTLEVLLTDDTVVTLEVTDDSGAVSTATLEVAVSVGPKVADVKAFHDGSGDVRLSWSWNGEEGTFNVLRNGEAVGTTDQHEVKDRSLMSGTNVYTVQPVNDERVFVNGATAVSTNVVLEAVDEPAPSSTLGYLLAGVLLLALLASPWVASQTGGGRR